MRDVDLSKGVRTALLTFNELSAYVSNEAGLGKDVVARIGQVLKITDAQIKEVWDSRFQSRTFIEKGIRKI